MKSLPSYRTIHLVSLVILSLFVFTNSYATDTILISKTQNIQGSGNSVSPTINEDGNFIAFESTSGNLVGDNNTLTQILLKSVSPDVVYRVSVDNNGIAGNAASFSPSISADGQRIVFYSSATNLISNDTNGLSDVFLHDITNRTTTLISATASGVIANQESADAMISGDGNYVVFSSASTNLVSTLTNGNRNIYIKDITSGTIDIISKNSNGDIGDQDSFSPAISYNGRYISFVSIAGNLDSLANNNFYDVYLHDRFTNKTERISLSTLNNVSNGHSLAASISADGQTIAYHSQASNLISIDNNNLIDIFVYDRNTKITERASLTTSPDGISFFAKINNSGRFVSFYSTAKNLVSNDVNNRSDLFVYDRYLKQIELASVSSSNVQSSSNIDTTVAISGDGRFVAFSSTAASLVSGDSNGNFDVLLHHRNFTNIAPVAIVQDIPVQQCNNGGVSVTLDASSSYDIDQESLSYAWSGDFGTAQGQQVNVFLTYGTQQINLVVTDTAGGSDSTLISVIVDDSIPPTIVADAPITLEATNTSGTAHAVNFTASDNCAISNVSVLPSPSFYPLGNTNVTVTALDVAGLTANDSTIVNVVDTIKPILTLPVNLSVEASAKNSVINIGQASATDIFPVTISNNALVSYPLGNTSVTWTATDSNGNTKSDIQTITVKDTTVPTIIPPVDIVKEATNTLTNVLIGNATINDIFNVDVTNNAPIGFPLGTTLVQWTATDENGNSSSATQKIIIIDTTAPVINAGSDITLEATSANGVSFTPIYTSSDSCNCGSLNIVITPQKTNYPLGINIITITATDSSGNTASDSMQLNVVDTTAPKLTIPSNLTTEATANLSSIIIGDANATDLFPVNITHNSPLLFPLGTTQITWIATDINGNSTKAIQTITVIDSIAPTFEFIVHKPILKRPNHKMKYVATIKTIQDTVDVSPNVDIQVSSNWIHRNKHEKHGKRHVDWKIKKMGSEWQVWVRAEKIKHSKQDRKYFINVNVSDINGNSASQSTDITVLRHAKKRHEIKRKKEHKKPKHAKKSKNKHEKKHKKRNEKD